MSVNLEQIQFSQISNTNALSVLKMSLASIVMIIISFYICIKKMPNLVKKQKVKIKSARDQIKQQIQQDMLKRKQTQLRSTTHLSFRFNEQQFESQQEQLIDMMNDQGSIESIVSKYSFNFNQAKNNFLNSLRQKDGQSLIYLDKNDIKERQLRKEQMERKKKGVSEIVCKGLVQGKKDQKSSQQQKLGGLISDLKKEKKQKDGKKEIGEKVVFGDKGKVDVDLSKKVDFAGVKLLGNANQSLQNFPPKQTPQNPQQNLSFIKPSQTSNTLFKPQTQQTIQPQIIPGSQPNTPSLFQQIPQPLFQQDKQPQVNIPNVSNPPLFKQSIPQPLKKQQNNKINIIQNQIKPPQPIKKQDFSYKNVPLFPNPQSNSLSMTSANSTNTLDKKLYLQKFIDYGVKATQSCQLPKTKPNNFGRSISQLKQLYDTSIDFINTINVGNPKEVQTLACKIFDFLFYKNIPSWPKQQGWQKFPPRGKQGTNWKISVNTYVLKLNIYKAMGHQKLWLIIFGKLLHLLQFTWKRQQIIKNQMELDLIKNGYFNVAGQKQQMAAKYFTRLDLITYFLFCMTTFDPQLFAQYVCQTAKQDQRIYQEIKKSKYKWSYTNFWILVDVVLSNKAKTYFRPILQMNILSAIYLQLRRNKLNSSEFSDFDHLKKYLLKSSFQYTSKSALTANQQVSKLGEIEVQKKQYNFDGQDLTDQLQTLHMFFKQRGDEYKKGIDEFEKKCSLFYYFKGQGFSI